MAARGLAQGPSLPHHILLPVLDVDAWFKVVVNHLNAIEVVDGLAGFISIRFWMNNVGSFAYDRANRETMAAFVAAKATAPRIETEPVGIARVRTLRRRPIVAARHGTFEKFIPVEVRLWQEDGTATWADEQSSP